MVRLTKRRWLRVLAVAYPVMTTLVVVATANHYLLDAVAGAAVVALAVRLSRHTAKSGTAGATAVPANASATRAPALEDSPAT